MTCVEASPPAVTRDLAPRRAASARRNSKRRILLPPYTGETRSSRLWKMPSRSSQGVRHGSTGVGA
jgi:hypothetical protein